MEKKETHRLIIAGPCSAESEEQVQLSARTLKATGQVDFMRAGVWKPRTSPGSFEGYGEKALPWLEAASKETGLPYAIEVAKPEHVEAAMKHGVGMMWIGARTTVNPFAVQALADAMQGIDIPVFIKNPINPDYKLWLGAFERFKRANVLHLGAIHRGFSAYQDDKYRNLPLWEIPIRLQAEHPEIPLICDPSHIAGKRKWIAEISQTAMDLNFSGLMIETHPNPSEALSDPDQQVYLKDFEALIQSIRQPQQNGVKEDALSGLRSQIDSIDYELLTLVERRMEIAKKIGRFKKDNNITILQPERWRAIYEDRQKKGKEKNLSSDFMRRYLDALHLESIKQQMKVIHDREEGNGAKG